MEKERLWHASKFGRSSFVRKSESCASHSMVVHPFLRQGKPEGGRYAGFWVLTFAGRALKMKPAIAKTAESGAPELV